MNPTFLGQLMLFAGNFVPRGYVGCNGQLLSIAEYDTLYVLLGTTYGGDGVTTFGVPDLRGRAPQHFGQGLGLPSVALGQISGTETITLTSAQMPAHNHTLTATVTPSCSSTDDEDSTSPVNSYPRAFPGTNTYSTTQNGQTGQAGSFNIPLMPTGSGYPMDNTQPSLAMTFCMATEGIFPSQP